MTLFDVLKLIYEDAFPLIMEFENGKNRGIDSRPQSVFNVTLCFMSEEETWITCNIQNEILIPWYDCKVNAIQPDNENSICVWLDDTEYILKNFEHCVEMRGKGEQE